MSRRWLVAGVALLLGACATEAESPFDIDAVESEGEAELRTSGGSVSIRLGSVPRGFFPDRPVMWLGRTFVEEEYASAAVDRLILSKALWKRLGGRPDIVGTAVQVGGEERAVVGVLMEDAELESRADALIPR